MSSIAEAQAQARLVSETRRALSFQEPAGLQSGPLTFDQLAPFATQTTNTVPSTKAARLQTGQTSSQTSFLEVTLSADRVEDLIRGETQRGACSWTHTNVPQRRTTEVAANSHTVALLPRARGPAVQPQPAAAARPPPQQGRQGRVDQNRLRRAVQGLLSAPQPPRGGGQMAAELPAARWTRRCSGQQWRGWPPADVAVADSARMGREPAAPRRAARQNSGGA